MARVPATKKPTTRKVGTPRAPRAKLLATLTDEERTDYILRYNMVEAKRREMLAAACYLDQLGEQFIAQYDLPKAYNLDLETGKITERV
jgi:hypothetical protein